MTPDLWVEADDLLAELRACRESDDTPVCPRCGGYQMWEDCDEPGCDDGYVSLYDDDPSTYAEGAIQPCPLCGGASGWWYCPSCRAKAQQEARRS